MIATRAALLAATGLIIGCLRLGSGAPTHGPSEPLRPVFATGPRSATAPADARVVQDASELAAILSAPEGPGELWLAARVYEGNWTIRRPLRLHGVPGSVLQGRHQGTVLSIEADQVTVENLVIRGSGRRHTAEDAGVKAHGSSIVIERVRIEDSLFGFLLNECHGCRVEASELVGSAGDTELRGDGIKLWESDDSVIRHCRVEHARDIVVWYSRRVRLEGNIVEHSRYGAHFMYAHDVLVENNWLSGNIVGIFVMYSARVRARGNVLAGARGPAGIGIGFKESDSVELERNWLIGNTTGLYLDRTPRSPKTPARFAGNVLALNQVALRFHSSNAGIHFLRNDFRDNVSEVEVEGGGDALGSVFDGNFWSDYAGYDLDRDGRGDVAHEVKQLSSELLESHPSLRLFQGTLAMSLIDGIARVAPVLASHRLLVDPNPALLPVGG